VKTAIRISKQSTLLAEQRYYAPTYLIGDDGLVVFVGDVAEVRGPSGRVQTRTQTGVVTFDTDEAMVGAIIGGGWREDPTLDGDARKWKSPTDWRAAVSTEDTDG